LCGQKAATDLWMRTTGHVAMRTTGNDRYTPPLALRLGEACRFFLRGRWP
jgi:hypothetical protein